MKKTKFSQPIFDYINSFEGNDFMGHTYSGALVLFGMWLPIPDIATIPYIVDGKYQKAWR